MKGDKNSVLLYLVTKVFVAMVVVRFWLNDEHARFSHRCSNCCSTYKGLIGIVDLVWLRSAIELETLN